MWARTSYQVRHATMHLQLLGAGSVLAPVFNSMHVRRLRRRLMHVDA